MDPIPFTYVAAIVLGLSTAVVTLYSRDQTRTRLMLRNSETERARIEAQIERMIGVQERGLASGTKIAEAVDRLAADFRELRARLEQR